MAHMPKRASKSGKASPARGRGAIELGTALKALLIIVAGLLVFSAALPGDWSGDDNFYLANNPLLNDPSRLWKIWFAPGNLIEYYPITETVQYVQWGLWHRDAFGYVATNIVLHLANALLVWRLLARFKLRLAWLGGLIFAIHPMAVESVEWISELKNTLSLAPFLLAMTCWIDFEETRQPRDYALALGLFLIAMLCKITMAPFAFVILLYAWWKRGRIDWRDVRVSLPFLAIAIALAAATWLLGAHFAQVNDQPEPRILVDGPLSRLALAGTTGTFYFAKFFFPWAPAPMYAQWQVDPPTWPEILPWLAWGLALAACWHRRATWGRHVILGLGFFGLTLAPFLGFRTISYMCFTWAMDHFLYLPMIGLLGLVVAAIDQLGRRMPASARPWAIGAGTLVLLALGAKAHIYATIYSTQESLYAYAVRVNPNSATAHSYWGMALAARNRLPEAIAQLHIAILLDPDNPELHFNLATTYLQANQLADAYKEFSETIRLRPGDPDAWNDQGEILADYGRNAEAMSDFQHAATLSSTFAQPHNDMAILYTQAHQFDAAVTELQKAVDIAPLAPQLRDNLGDALLEAKRAPEALQQYQAALSLDPTDAHASSGVQAISGAR